jgi:hypothetical protein
VSDVEANANNVLVTTPDTLVTAAAGVSGVMAGTRTVSEGTTVNTTPEYDGGAGGEKPVVTSVAPAQGSAEGSTAVTITGKYFTGAASVTIGGKAAASYKVVSDTTITAVTPAGKPGMAIVAVTTVDGTGTKAAAYTYVAAPVIASVSPNAGLAAGGTAVTITGTGFTGATSITLGGTAATSFTVVSDTSITAVTPAKAAGTADITVTTAGGTGTKTDAYTFVMPPEITGLAPSEGPLAGGNTVTITGSNLQGATAVFFGTMAASFAVISDTQIAAVAPAGSVGGAFATVTTAGGTSPIYPYVYVAPPVVGSVTPDRGAIGGGSTVAITGSNFLGATAVTFGGAPAASFTINPDGSITAVTPAGTAGPADVAVTATGGIDIRTGAYTYAPAPTISSVIPAAGPLMGGTTVTITGANLTGATQVTFNGSIAFPYTVNSDTQITAVTPPNLSSYADVAVLSPCGSALAVDAYNYVPAPVIFVASPNVGPAAGGSTVTITGTCFTGATAVSFGGTPATSYIVVSDT